MRRSEKAVEAQLEQSSAPEAPAPAAAQISLFPWPAEKTPKANLAEAAIPEPDASHPALKTPDPAAIEPSSISEADQASAPGAVAQSSSASVAEVSAPPPKPPPLPVAPSTENLSHPFAQLTTGDRIAVPSYYRDRTYAIAAMILMFWLLAGTATAIRWSELPEGPSREEAEAQDRRGQLEKSEVITVDLVEAPDPNSRSKVSQEGENAPTAQPTPPVPNPAAETTPPEPNPADKPQEEHKQAEAKPDKPQQKPLTVDDFDVSMAEYTRAIERAEAERKQPKAQQQQRAAQLSRVGAAAAVGKQSPYMKAVLAAVARNKPQLYITRGEVLVQFVLTRNGSIGALKVVQSSGDKLLDQIALDAVKGVKFPVPPPDVDPNDLNYMIHYIMN